jgi:hypothetical protein
VGYWQRAGQHAQARAGYQEAIHHLTRGLEVLEELPDTHGYVHQGAHAITLEPCDGSIYTFYPLASPRGETRLKVQGESYRITSSA